MNFFPHIKNWRGYRYVCTGDDYNFVTYGGMQNIIPSVTGSSDDMGKVIPSLKNKLGSVAFEVPGTSASAVDLTCRLVQSVQYDEIMKEVKNASNSHLKGILKYIEGGFIPSDTCTERESSIFDASAGMQLNSNFIKLIAWYRDEYGYTCRIIDLIKYIHKTSKRNNSKLQHVSN
jgi:glyceraldehyde 3-phosphate dehydrogenase